MNNTDIEVELTQTEITADQVTNEITSELTQNEITVEQVQNEISTEINTNTITAESTANEISANINKVEISAEIVGYANKGPRGLSAYAVAVEEGYEGTEEQWLATLVGPQGIQGIQGEPGNSVVWLGEYSADTLYEPNSLVEYLGSTYISILETIGNLPTNTTYWNLMVEKGDMLKSVYDPIKGNKQVAFAEDIPTSLSELSEDTTHRVVTDTEKSTWNGKQDALVADTDYLTPETAETTYQPIKGDDDNYVTDAQVTIINNTSGTNTGDQTLPTKASATDINVGTDDAKFVTSKALKDTVLDFHANGIAINQTYDETLGGALQVNGEHITTGSFNRGSWNAPTKGAVTQVVDNTSAQHSVIVGKRADTGGRLYGIDLYDNYAGPAMRLYSGSNYINIGSTSTVNGSAIITASSLLNAVYPVGSIYMSVVSTNPNTLFGGTWVAWGSGRVPVGVNTGDTDFNTVEKTGGSKTVSASNHTHASASHTHTVASHTHTSASHAHTSAAHTHTSAAHTHSLDDDAYAKIHHASGTVWFREVSEKPAWTDNAKFTIAGATSSTSNTYGTGLGGDTNSTTPGATGSTTPGNTGSTTPGNTGGASLTTNSTTPGATGSAGSETLNIQQQYITCYMWKRTA